MCGIYFRLKRKEAKQANLDHQLLQRRGPDATRTIVDDQFVASFYRLAIVGVESGMQPFMSDNCVMLCNGEIYNHRELEDKFNLKCDTKSDCECILRLYKKIGIEETVRQMNGEWAFCLYDLEKKQLYYARDRLGRKPLFWSYQDDAFEVCSLYSGIANKFKSQVMPGMLYQVEYLTFEVKMTQYHSFKYVPNVVTHDQIYKAFVKEVCMRVTQSERKIGFLLSGGFDSSLVLSVALDSAKVKQPEVFTFGFSEDAPDVKSAELMVNWLRKKYGPDCINWHKVIMPISHGIKALPEVVKVLETYDTTTIRASTPMYLISRYIAHNSNVRVIISGEGSDELFGGYLYFRYAPSEQEFQKEIVTRLKHLYLYDVLRADRTTAAWGLEVRTPFLGDEFVSTVLGSRDLLPDSKTTKKLIRDVVSKLDLLPDEILWGKKEAFSDAVGLSWKDAIAEHAEQQEIPDFDHSNFISPQTKEMKYFQYLFNQSYPKSWHLLKSLWLPNQNWVKTGVEPSARVLSAYQS